MKEVDDVDSIFDLAISREIEAYQFYMALSGRTADFHIREIFENMAREELRHKEKLELEVIKGGRTVKPAEIPVFNASDYSQMDESEMGEMDYKEAVLISIEKEDESFRTYVSLLGLVKDTETREVLFGLAEEEMRHKLRWQAEYEVLVKEDHH